MVCDLGPHTNILNEAVACEMSAAQAARKQKDRKTLAPGEGGCY